MTELLDAHFKRRPWDSFRTLASQPPNALAIERGRLVGGTYMDASPFAKHVAVRYGGECTIEDKYLGTVLGQRVEVVVQPHPLASRLEPIDYEQNLRVHTTALWKNSFLERRRHTAKLARALDDPEISALWDEAEIMLLNGFGEMYDELFGTFYDYADLSGASFKAWVSEHADSSTGMKDEYGMSLTWARVLNSDVLLSGLQKEVTDVVRALVDGYPDNRHKVLDHKYVWDVSVLFRALRNRPETSFSSRAGNGVLSPKGMTYHSTRYRDRAAGGIKGLSWLFALIPKDKLHQYVTNALEKGMKATGASGCPVSGPIFDGLDSYIEVLETPADRKSYVDMANCEKFMGSKGFSIGRIGMRGSGEKEMWQAATEDSGHALTTEDNILGNFTVSSLVDERLGLQPTKKVMHGDNICYIGVKPDANAEIEATYGELYTAETIWLGHGVDRVVGLKFTKDNKGDAINLPLDYHMRPLGFRYSKEKAPEVTAALLCRDVIARDYGGPTYIDFLKSVTRDYPETRVEQILGHWNGLADRAYEMPTGLFAQAQTIVEDKWRELFSE